MSLLSCAKCVVLILSLTCTSGHPTSAEGSPTSQTRLKDWRTHPAGCKIQSPLWSLESQTSSNGPQQPSASQKLHWCLGKQRRRLANPTFTGQNRAGRLWAGPGTSSNHLLRCSLTLAIPLVHTALSLTESEQRK